MGEIPIVDIGAISLAQSGRIPSEDDWKTISGQLGHALSSIGFVYLKNHGVPQNLVDEAFEKSREFFALDLDTKKKYVKPTGLNFGYVEPNREILEVGKYSQELRESFDLRWNVCSKFENGVDPVDSSPGFYSSLFALAKSCHPLIQILHRLLARALEIEEHGFFNRMSKHLEDPAVASFSTFRSIFYPPVPESVEPGTIRCSPHTDYGTFSLLFQDAMGGLEVQNANGSWVPATPIPGTILVNTGDLLSFWSGGKFPATTHRVLIPEIELKKRLARQSMVYFVHPDDDVSVLPLGTHPEGGKDPQPVSAYEHTKNRLERSYKF